MIDPALNVVTCTMDTSNKRQYSNSLQWRIGRKKMIQNCLTIIQGYPQNSIGPGQRNLKKRKFCYTVNNLKLSFRIKIRYPYVRFVLFGKLFVKFSPIFHVRQIGWGRQEFFSATVLYQR